LDLAHGPGNLLPELAAAGFRPVGYDLSPFMGRIARRKMVRRGVEIPLARGIAQTLPFPSGTFNSVVSTFPAEFILDPATLGEIGRVLVPDGIFVLVPIALLTGLGPATQILEWLYAITGQRPTGQITLPPQFLAAGFHSEIRWASLPYSRVMIILNHLVNPS
jgi:ubiquinone/menaquinone biosynthesis C-methylase UbiE